jgi:hypothetical protein
MLENYTLDMVEALNRLPEPIKNDYVDMKSTKEPVCGTPGCFAGLISIVADDIPELKQLYGGGIGSGSLFSASTSVLKCFVYISVSRCI